MSNSGITTPPISGVDRIGGQFCNENPPVGVETPKGASQADTNLVRLRTHHNNVIRYRQLLTTPLTPLERQFIERRLTEERSAIDLLASAARHIGDSAMR
ncbi:hypothetical protein [Bradyrhizobium sp. ORS 111]|uniref:hypothetical protein n=1 Tax=Bradyrhizobium sp. ORS 111 TaxID=1685958 RepID=UPI00388E25FB